MTLLRPDRAEQRAVTFADVWGTGADLVGPASLAGEKTDFATVIGLDAVAAVVGLKADIVSMLPAHGYRNGTDGVGVKLATTPAIIGDPSPTVDAMAWKAQAVMSLALWGNIYGLVVTRDGLGYPTSVELLDPAQVNVVEHPPTGRPEYWYAGQRVANDDMVHVPGRFVRPGSVKGLPPLEQFRETWGLAAAARNYGARWFGQGAHPTGVLMTDKVVANEDGTIDILKAKLRRLLGGRGSREPLVLSQGLKYETIQEAPATSQMAETQRFMIGAVCRAIGFPADMVGGDSGGSSITYANVEQRSIDLLKFYVDPDLVRLERLWTRCLPRPQYAKVTRAALLRTDLLTRYRAHDLSIRAGFGNPDEARRHEDMPPIPDGAGAEFLWPPYATSVQQTQPEEKP